MDVTDCLFAYLKQSIIFAHSPNWGGIGLKNLQKININLKKNLYENSKVFLNSTSIVRC